MGRMQAEGGSVRRGSGVHVGTLTGHMWKQIREVLGQGHGWPTAVFRCTHDYRPLTPSKLGH